MDTITFLGPRIPLEVKKLFSVLPKCKQEQVIKLLYFVLEYIKIKGSENAIDFSSDQIPTEFEDTTFSHFCEQIGLGGALEKQVAVSVFIGLFVILKAAIRSRLKFDLLQKDLVQELRVPDFLSNEIIKILKANQGILEKKLAENKIRYPFIKDFKWRVDVTLSTNSMQRVLKPSILMEIATSEGKVRTFEVSVEKYQELRYQVARTLKDFQELDKLQILKLQ